MTSLNDAFTTLGLTVDADARAVRQAYARRLKLIDQATEIEAFQSLREAYELALAATRRGPSILDDSSPATPAVAPPAPVEPPPDLSIRRFDGASQAEAGLDEFSRRLAAGIASPQEATALLQQAREQLVSLEAGSRFEQQVALRLAQGWQPGHEHLFDAAAEVFNWMQDRRHLLALGGVGELLQEALIERQMFRGQPGDVLHRQLHLVRRLRDATPPSRTLLRDEQPMLRILVRRFPHWLGMVTPMANIEQWLGGPQAVQAALAMPEPGASVASASDEFSWPRILFALIWVAWMLWRYFG